MAALLIHSLLPPKPHTLPFLPLSPRSLPLLLPISSPKLLRPLHFPSRSDFRVGVDDGDGDAGGIDEYYLEEDEVEEVDNKKDFDVEYDAAGVVAGSSSSSSSGASLSVDDGDLEIVMVERQSFVSTQGWDPETVVDYRIHEAEFHKICLLDCDFFIRKPPDPDEDVYDFREMYVTPPDTDIYAIPKVLAPMPEKYICCAKSDYGGYNQTEPPVFLTKHYKNRRLKDPEFVLDFEEIYVIDSKTKSITRARVLVTAPGGRNRDRKDDLLVIGDKGRSFKIIHTSEREDPSTVIQKEEWAKSRQDMEKHLSKLRDFNISNWF
ncbi:PLASTID TRANSCRIPTIONALLY ACTIVE protein 6, chloroplastic [Dionaea muscipula]